MIGRIFIVALAALWLSGCGNGIARVAYNNGGFAVRLMVNEYFDLEEEQTGLLKARLARFHQWHRRQELPLYAGTFQGAAERVSRGLARDDVVWAIGEIRARYRSLAVQAVDESAPVLATLNAGNFAALEKKFADSNAKFAKEYLSGSQAKRDRARAKRLEERFENFMGELSDEQRELIARFVQSEPGRSAARLEERKRRQQEFAQLIRQYQASPELATRLRDYFVNWENERDAEQAERAREWEERLIALILDMDRTMTPQQRANVAHRFQSYAEDCRVLARQGRSDDETRASLDAQPAH